MQSDNMTKRVMAKKKRSISRQTFERRKGTSPPLKENRSMNLVKKSYENIYLIGELGTFRLKFVCMNTVLY